jgi:hypothetical protein
MSVFRNRHSMYFSRSHMKRILYGTFQPMMLLTVSSCGRIDPNRIDRLLSQGTGEPTVDGLRVKRNPSKATKAAANDAASASAGVRQTPTLERLMCNCLGCGKIYDCRGTLSASTAAFVGKDPGTN